MQQTATSDLIERLDGFNYDYRMKCACGGVSALSAAAYFAEADEAHMDCEHCDDSIHFGPAVLDIRDERDPALDDALVSRLAWYHTSTWPDWPSPDFATKTDPELRESFERFRWRATYDPTRHLTKALHLGTYEAAIENMLRRMHDQADAGAQFYLYRVAIRVQPGRINAGYRDENDDVAANITVGDLDTAGLDVVRYLNVHEAMGSLSLAVRPEVIAGVQRVPLPIAEVTALMPCDLLSVEAELLDADADAWTDSAQRLAAIDPKERRLMRLGLRPDPDELIRRSEERELRRYGLWHDFEDTLAKRYLPNVSSVVRRDVVDALGSWRTGTKSQNPRAFAEQFRQIAALLERPHEVTALLSAQA